MSQTWRDGRRDRLEEEIAASRERLRHDAEVLRHRLSVAHMEEKMHEKIEQKTQSLANGAGAVLTTARDNPGPALLIGAGFAWLAFDATRRSSDGFRARTDEVLDTVREGSSRLGGEARHAGEVARDRASSLADASRERASALADASRDRLREARGDTRGVLERHPLAIVGASVLGGALLGALLPSTRFESRVLAPARARLHEGAQRVGHEVVETARRAGHEAADAVRPNGVSDAGRS